ncbi:MAG: PAQR family membrane homeostasis protein TrhA [Candidatus Nanopelagicales bacterium]
MSSQATPPLLRGWLHLGTAPVALLAGAALVILAPTLQARFTIAIFTLSAVALFSISATYHTINWTPNVKRILRRLDHANIFLIIAGTYTPLTVIWLETSTAQILLSLVWGGSILGLLFRVFWLTAPRWLYVPIYIALGWAALLYLPDFYASAGAVIVGLILAGGILYSAGAIIYAIKKPNLSVKYFGFHELFHSFTIAAFFCHYAAIAITVAKL